MGAVALNSGLSNLLFHSLLTQLFASAKAQAAEMTTGRYYVNINFNGGPPRYMFDNWLKTQVSEPELTHGSYNSTSFVFNSAGIVSGSEHKLYPYNNYLVPQVFQNLGNQKAEILDSFLVIRGFGTGDHF